MKKDNKRLLLYLGILFLAELLIYKLPHDSYSIIQYVIKPIRDGGSVFYISSLIPLALFMISIIGFINLDRFANKSKLLIFVLVVVIIMPLMKWSIDFSRTNYYWIKQERLNAIDIAEPNISLSGTNDELTITMKFKLVDYSRSTNEFKFRVYFPESLSEYSGVKICESQNSYRTYGNRGELNVDESIIVYLENENILDYQWSNEEVTYELYNDDEVVKNIDHGL